MMGLIDLLGLGSRHGHIEEVEEATEFRNPPFEEVFVAHLGVAGREGLRLESRLDAPPPFEGSLLDVRGSPRPTWTPRRPCRRESHE